MKAQLVWVRVKVMSFTRVGIVLAHLLFWLGLFSVAMSLVFIFSGIPKPQTIDGQMAINPGRQLDSGAKYMLIGLAIGVLCEISSRVNK